MTRSHRHFVLSVVSLVSITTTTLSGKTLMLDTFADKDYRDGSPATWTTVFTPQLDASTGDLSIVNEGCCGGAGWDQRLTGDVSIQTQARIVQGWLGLTARFGGGNGNDGYYLETTANDELGFVTRVEGQLSEWTIVPEIGIVHDEDVFLQLDVVGNQVSGWYWTENSGSPMEPQLSATLTDQQLIERGLAGFYVGGESTLRYAQYADSPIPVPEPCAGLLFAVGFLVVTTSFRSGKGRLFA